MIKVPNTLSKSALVRFARSVQAENEELKARLDALEKKKTKNKKEEVK